MKTIEEKAKAYDEIIERAKTMLSAGEVMYGKENNASQLITDLIPELKESEDEKIIKCLMEIVDWGCLKNISVECGVNLTDIRKWLEKQKESLHIPETCKENADSFTSEDERMMREFNDWLCEEIECRTNDLRDEKDRRTLNMLFYVLTKVKDWLEKQKEEKLDSIRIKCKEHDERHEEIRVTEIIESIVRVYGKTQGEFIAGYDIDTLIHWVREAFDCLNKQNIQKEQKPAWSEEDEKKRKGLIEGLEKRMGFGWASDPFSREEYIDWLKNLPIGWKPSEEDIKMLEHIIGQYETGNKNSKVMGYLPRVEELSFLKKVLSKWKN